PPAPRSTLFPYTTLFRSIGGGLWTQWRSDQATAAERAVAEARLLAAQVDDHLGNLESLMAGLSRAVSVNPADTTANDAVLKQLKDRKSTRLNSSHLGISY